jgi:hypothetical protein
MSGSTERASRIPTPSDPVPLRARVAAVMFAGDAAFGVVMPVALASLWRTGQLPPTPWGFRAFSGPFEALGPTAFTALGSALMAVCALDVVAGVRLWRGEPAGARLGLATTPFVLALGAGFALPFLLIPAPIRAALILKMAIAPPRQAPASTEIP